MKYPYGKNILITGASSGLGKSAAEMFAKAGYSVWGVSRSCNRSEMPCGEGVIRMLPMNVTDDISVQSATAEILAQAGTLGIVLHCAGFGIAGACEDTPLDAAHAQMETNYFGVLRVNRAVLPAMRKQGFGLVLVTSSVAGLVSIPFQSHYASSKFALEAAVQALRMECRPYGIRAALLEPGDTKTGFTGARQMTIPENSPYHAACDRAVGKMAKDEENGKPPESVAKKALALAQKKNPRMHNVIGLEYRMMAGLIKILPESAAEAILRRMYCGT